MANRNQIKELQKLRITEESAIQDLRKFAPNENCMLYTPLITRIKNIRKEYAKLVKEISFIEPLRKEYLIRKYKITKRHIEHCSISFEKLFNATDNAMLEEELKDARVRYLAEIKKWDILFDRRVKLLRERYESSWCWGWDF